MTETHPAHRRRLAAAFGAVALLLAQGPALSQTPEEAATEKAQPRAVELTFTGAGGIELPGTLVLPAGEEGPFPGVLLLPGSGPTDRDGNQPPMLRTDLLRQIADDLASRGVASFRFDKRAAHANAGLWPRTPDEVAAFFAWDHFVQDAEAALRALGARGGIDASRVAVLGHSEGGLIALALADRMGKHAPPALVLAGTTGRRLDHVIRDQVDRLLPLQVPDAALRETIRKDLDRAIDSIRADRTIPADLHPALASLFNPSSLDVLYAYFTIEPAELASSYKGPVLVVQGKHDAQVTVDDDLPPLKAALIGRPGVATRIQLIENASHNFKKVGSPIEPGFAGPVAPEALGAIGDWLSETLKSPPATIDSD